jgi:hypothetical protein
MTPPIPPGSLWQPAGLPARCHLTGASPTADMAGEPASSPELSLTNAGEKTGAVPPCVSVGGTASIVGRGL